ncbi:DUF805 domain-containing protein [Agrococcus sp. SGAir0287]|uniref:DUF805 domain-containing protein n=1 Tax=Agrococcus sp. SGAir0287 TaxID=2070347 RepID=UPI0010CD1509|nr:DUF805 domain-containing protein [Agrococcus sp. SGAir0287]QCR18570.1 hypothetical protein C1N71_03160 [Agrococcus sp. SGAir0287]
MHVPLDQPHYGVGPAGMVRFLRKYATFRGRASRSEFWWAQLTLAIAGLVLLAPGVVAFVVVFGDRMAFYSSDPATTPAAPFGAFADALWAVGLIGIGALVDLAFLVPTLALAWRRAQDAGLPGGIGLLIQLGGGLLAGVTLVAAVAPLVLGFLDSSAKGARFEPSPSPALPPGVDPAAWHAERLAAASSAAGWTGAQARSAPQPVAWPTVR